MNTSKLAKKTLVTLVGISTALALMGLLAMFSWHIIGFRNEYSRLIVRLFDLSTDNSIPTWYSSQLHLFAAVILLLISYKMTLEHKPDRFHWIVLTCIFLLFSIDEVAQIHEQIGSLTIVAALDRVTFGFHYCWIVSGILFCLITGGFFCKFLLRLPVRHRRCFILAGACFIAGALGIESINSEYSKINGSWNMTYAAVTALEEYLEMLGISVFIYGLIDYNQTHVQSVRVNVSL